MAATRTIPPLLLAFCFTAGTAFAQKASPIDEASSHDGLTKVQVKGMDLAYKRTDVDMGKYGKVIVDPVEVATVTGMALVLSFLATIYPSWRAARIEPAEALRYE